MLPRRALPIGRITGLGATRDFHHGLLAVVAQWRTPDHRYFTVRTAEETCTLRQDVTSGGWELTEVERGVPPSLG